MSISPVGVVRSTVNTLAKDLVPDTNRLENIVKVLAAVINAAVVVGGVKSLNEFRGNVTMIKNAFDFSSEVTLFQAVFFEKMSAIKKINKALLFAGKTMQCVDNAESFGLFKHITIPPGAVSSRLGSNPIFDVALKSENWAATRGSFLVSGMSVGIYNKLVDTKASNANKALAVAHSLGKIGIVSINSFLKPRNLLISPTFTATPLYHTITIGTALLGLSRDLNDIREARAKQKDILI